MTVASVLDQPGFLLYADSYFRSHALPLSRPTVTLVRPVQTKNADVPMLVTPFGMV